MENLVLFGLENVHIAFQDDSPGGYESPEAVPGAVSFATTPSSEQVIFHADNKRYFVRENNNGYNGNLEMALIPDHIKARMLGWYIDGKGMLVEVADGKPEKFALMGQVLGDAKNRRFVYYDVMAMRHGQESATKADTIDPTTQTIPITITPILISGMNVVKGDIELSNTNTAEYNGFFNAVYTPDGAAAGVNKTALDSAIALGESLTPGNYTLLSWNAFDDVLTAAGVVSLDATADQQAVNDATRALRAAFISLVVDEG